MLETELDPRTQQLILANRTRWINSAGGLIESAPEAKIQSASITKLVLERLEVKPGKKYLDLGAGTGTPALDIAQKGGLVTTLDVSPEMLEYAAREAQRLGFRGFNWRVHDFNDPLPFPDETFDGVTGIGSICFAADGTRLVKETARVARPGSNLVFAVFSESDDPSNQFRITQGTIGKYESNSKIVQPGDPDQFKYKKRDALAADLKDAGFINPQVEYIDRIPFPYKGTVKEFMKIRLGKGASAARLNALGEKKAQAEQEIRDQLVPIYNPRTEQIEFTVAINIVSIPVK